MANRDNIKVDEYEDEDWDCYEEDEYEDENDEYDGCDGDCEHCDWRNEKECLVFCNDGRIINLKEIIKNIKSSGKRVDLKELADIINGNSENENKTETNVTMVNMKGKNNTIINHIDTLNL